MAPWKKEIRFGKYHFQVLCCPSSHIHGSEKWVPRIVVGPWRVNGRGEKHTFVGWGGL